MGEGEGESGGCQRGLCLSKALHSAPHVRQQAALRRPPRRPPYAAAPSGVVSLTMAGEAPAASREFAMRSMAT